MSCTKFTHDVGLPILVSTFSHSQIKNVCLCLNKITKIQKKEEWLDSIFVTDPRRNQRPLQLSQTYLEVDRDRFFAPMWGFHSNSKNYSDQKIVESPSFYLFETSILTPASTSISATRLPSYLLDHARAFFSIFLNKGSFKVKFTRFLPPGRWWISKLRRILSVIS